MPHDMMQRDCKHSAQNIHALVVRMTFGLLTVGTVLLSFRCVCVCMCAVSPLTTVIAGGEKDGGYLNEV